MKSAYVYILASKKNGALYVGITTNLIHRITQHRSKSLPSFTSKYHICRLVHYEGPMTTLDAITREKRLKSWRRNWKILLIESINPDWNDGFHELN